VRVGDGVCVGEDVLVDVDVVVAVGTAGSAFCWPGVFTELRYQSPVSPRLWLRSMLLLVQLVSSATLRSGRSRRTLFP
jgi:hypothetical protein